eukprot:1154674-Pelagomonas_calceolata.AAC.1
MKKYLAEEFLPTSIKGKETYWLKRAVSFLHRKRIYWPDGDLEGDWEQAAPGPGCEKECSHCGKDKEKP